MGSVTYLDTKNGGGKQDRTADLLHAMQALSQLSYTPLLRAAKLMATYPTCSVSSLQL